MMAGMNMAGPSQRWRLMSYRSPRIGRRKSERRMRMQNEENGGPLARALHVFSILHSHSAFRFSLAVSCRDNPPRRRARLRGRIEEFQVALGDVEGAHGAVVEPLGVCRGDARDRFPSAERAAFDEAVEDALRAEVLAVRDAELERDTLAGAAGEA